MLFHIERCAGPCVGAVDAAEHRRIVLEMCDFLDGNTEPDRQTPMWGRGRIDHFGLHAATPEAFDTIRQRLISTGASDGTVNDFGSVYSMFFRDPDGLEGEVLVAKA